MPVTGVHVEPKFAEPPLVYRGVVKAYKTHFWQKKQTVLKGLDLEVLPGEIFGILGPNGAGKTTTIKLALGLIFPDKGEVKLMQRPAERPDSRQRVGYLPENAYYPDDLTGRELVDLAARLHGVPKAVRRERTAELLEKVGLTHAADRPIRKYSKGMVQRAGMARALVGDPAFVILDEPMSGLDPIGRRSFRDMILGLKRSGVTVLFASHVLSDAEMLCDRVAIMKEGRLRAVKDIGQIQCERKLLHWEVEVAGGERIAGAEPVASRGGARLFRLPATMSADEVTRTVRESGGELRALIPVRETLEDLFMSTVQGDGAIGMYPQSDDEEESR